MLRVDVTSSAIGASGRALSRQSPDTALLAQGPVWCGPRPPLRELDAQCMRGLLRSLALPPLVPLLISAIHASTETHTAVAVACQGPCHFSRSSRSRRMCPTYPR